MSKFVYQELVVKNIIGLVTKTQFFILISECQKPLFLPNLAKNSALKRLTPPPGHSAPSPSHLKGKWTVVGCCYQINTHVTPDHIQTFICSSELYWLYTSWFCFFFFFFFSHAVHVKKRENEINCLFALSAHQRLPSWLSGSSPHFLLFNSAYFTINK